MTEYISTSLEQTKDIAKKVLETGKRVIALNGNLGAGKTALTKCIAELLGVTETVTSPTFVIMKRYTPPAEHLSPPFPRRGLRGGVSSIVHIDAYRLVSAKEAETLNLKDILNNDENLVIIEWPEHIQEMLPENMLTVQCEFIDEMTRKYSF